MKNVFLGPVAVVIGSLLFAACGEGTVVDTGGDGGAGGGGASGSSGGAGSAGNDGTGAVSNAGSSGAGSAGTSGAGASNAGSSGGGGDLCAPDNACNGIEHCSDQCFTNDCCFLDCNCYPNDDRLHCSLSCD